MIEDFDKLIKYINSTEGLILADKFRTRLVNSKKYTDKLDDYFCYTQDVYDPAQARKILKL